MSEFDPMPRQRHPATSAFLVFLTFLAGFVIIGPTIGMVIALPFFDGNLKDLAAAISNPLTHPGARTAALVVQGSATLIGLILIPAAYWAGIEKKNPLDFAKGKSQPALVYAAIVVLVAAFMLPDSVVIDWNTHVTLPDFMKGFEKMARELEDRAEELTNFFTTMGSPGQFVFILLIVAVLPAVGEELVFRGMIQGQLQKTVNPHVAIWISAALFSAIHMQFFGFVPRMLLGAMFGYLYYWSGNLAIPVFAHFINNSISVTALYLNQLHIVDFDVDSTDAAPWPLVMMGTILTFGLLFFLKRRLDHSHSS